MPSETHQVNRFPFRTEGDHPWSFDLPWSSGTMLERVGRIHHREPTPFPLTISISILSKGRSGEARASNRTELKEVEAQGDEKLKSELE